VAGPALLLLGPGDPTDVATGRCYVWQSDEMAPGATWSADLELTIDGGAAGDQACSSAALLDDLDGDGDAELLVGAVGADLAGADIGAAYVVPPP
jgi:hypothetical protein